MGVPDWLLWIATGAWTFAVVLISGEWWFDRGYRRRQREIEERMAAVQAKWAREDAERECLGDEPGG